ncbi:Major facilitator superfamily (MFS) profile domain-containing protein [Caenorhabditis elegans]|uniref:Major facilitator superfamily (MFS) profile domain-containing protein n=1 Tax=Caenorhabditis elegans TaxID=6239 RepID=Q21381_CAEEL|nr:Major facilitator superfamily (MFS) profile domain-containing protein [Caenorhabditis elegans]CCD69249.1 Major facilitator superfamily (MFS) profile domain-containing protein [Caenorhabditis elegans]|eukprot:NP_508565.3 Uncharacterized protein CELE_K09C4.5 [Caenorhabditis elegans]
MLFNAPPNIIYMLLCFLLMDISNTVLMLLFPTLADIINEMNNHTLSAHFGIEPTIANVNVMNSMITGASTVGLFVSLFVLVPFAETKGRKYTVVYFRFIISVVSSLCIIMSALFQASEFFILGSAVNGLQLPMRMFVTMLFITECAPDKYRGFASTALIFSDVIGQVIMFSIATPNVLGRANTWVIFPLAVLMSSTVIFFMTLRLPESPKWLVRQNKIEEASRAIEFYHGENCCLNEVVSSYIKEKNLTQEDQISLRQVWENDTMREALKVLCSVSLFLVLDSGVIQGVYTVLLHKTAGFTVQEALNVNLVLVIIFLPTRFVGTYIIDHLGRRPVMLIAGIIVYSKTWLMLSTQFIIYFVGPSVLTKWLYIGVECLSESSLATGVTSLGILFISELFPPSARTCVAQALILVTMTINLPIISIFPIVYSFFGPGFFIIHVFSQFFFGAYLYRHMPETRGRAVYDIIESLDQEVASRTASFLEETTPLVRKRSSTLAYKRNSILNTSRTRALTFDHNLIPSGEWN